MTRKYTPEEAARAKARERIRVREWRRSRRAEGSLSHPSAHYANHVHVPLEVERDRQKRLAYSAPDLTAAVMGDPPPERSALYLRHLVSVCGGDKSG